VKTDTPLRVEGKSALSPFKAARTILTASGQVKIACGTVRLLISLGLRPFRKFGGDVSPRRINRCLLRLQNRRLGCARRGGAGSEYGCGALNSGRAFHTSETTDRKARRTSRARQNWRASAHDRDA
jgi:hypothetical protein